MGHPLKVGLATCVKSGPGLGPRLNESHESMYFLPASKDLGTLASFTSILLIAFTRAW